MNNVWNQEELDPFWLLALVQTMPQIKVVDMYDADEVYYDSLDDSDPWTKVFRIIEACKVADMCYWHVYTVPNADYAAWVTVIYDGPMPHISDYAVRLQDVMESCDSWAADIHTCKRQVNDLLETNE